MNHSFNIGDHVYNAKFPGASHLVITEQTAHNGWPYYRCVATDGLAWYIPQIHLSPKPINA